MKNRKPVFILLLTFFALTQNSCMTQKTAAQKIYGEVEDIDASAEQCFSMTLRQKVGQLFIVRPESLDPQIPPSEVHHDSKYARRITTVNSRMKKFYQQYPAGGVILFASNLINPGQVKKLNHQFHELNENSVPVFTYIDEEGGKVCRLANNRNFHLPQFTSMADIGASGDTDNAFNAGQTIGSYLNEYGFDVDFAPVADVNTNPKNPVIGKRAFSSEPETAAKMVSAFSDGLSDKKIYGCLKHFPGHGDTSTDTHKGYAVTNKSWNELLNCEIIPFRKGIENGTKFIMTAHISAPEVDPSAVPATMSHILLTEKLRGELDYKGLIVTDAMEMGAITKQYNPQTAAINAILAGADLVLIPYDYKTTFDAVVKAVENGTISEDRINQSVIRILAVKNKS